ncbi:hypothetical protein MBLNU459_g2308t1 [Dothideomycetes sp. NU459]
MNVLQHQHDEGAEGSVRLQRKPKSNPPGQKQLRFITTQGAPHPKRRRVTAACLTCRKRKVACSGERPGCVTCIQNHVDCGGYSNESASGGAGAIGFATQAEGSSRIKSENVDAPYQQLSQDGAPKPKPRLDVPATPNPAPTYPAPSPNLAHHDFASRMRPPPERLVSIQEDGHRDLSEIRSGSGSGPGSGSGSSSSLFSGPRNRMPYFRWLGPTAIMPGFKQMVVKIKRQDTQNLSQNSNDDAMSSPSINGALLNGVQRNMSVFSTTPGPVDSDMRTPLTLPFYDTSSMPPSELITHLCNTFFLHLGCNFLFLQRDRFLKDLEEKQVDAILVDAVCALAARFSNHSLLTNQATDGVKVSPSEHGSVFAQRARAALTDTFATPSVAAVQAALLLAYNEFGESRDSGLWMYLGISIRLAEDLGLQKLDGLRYEGRDGPTPKMVKEEEKGRPTEHAIRSREQSATGDDLKLAEGQRAVERERVDTFWAVFFLDRVVSSGTGRRSTLRDKDIELSFPSLDTTDPKTGWPSPFPALIRIVHLYGRVADLLNGIKEPSDITEETSRKLADMEARVTNFYQGLSSRLHFQAMNFHQYVKAGEGTNFVLLHFWFHTLIVLLHQPTLLKTFEGKMLQLFPNSPQLSMSSAKTIADILSYSQLIDTKASLGNPFTTQPIYIAACAFLKETAEQTATSKEQSRAQSTVASRAASPVRDSGSSKTSLGIPFSGPATTTERVLARHTLLATAASQHYQLCYKALENIETYWAGAKYILTVLDQKFKGVGDPLLYTVEEGESSLEQPKPEPAFTSPGWRRKASWLPSASTFSNLAAPFLFSQGRDKARGASGQGEAIGWTLTGTMNSPSTNLAWHFPSANNPSGSGATPLAMDSNAMMQYDNIIPNAPTAAHQTMTHTSPHLTTHLRTASSGSLPKLQRTHRPSLPSFASDNLLDSATLHSPFHTAPTLGSLGHQPLHFDTGTPGTTASFDFNTFASFSPVGGSGAAPHAATGAAPAGSSAQFGDMLIESQDVDMSLLGLEMLPWFDAPDIMPFLDGGGGAGAGDGGGEHAG